MNAEMLVNALRESKSPCGWSVPSARSGSAALRAIAPKSAPKSERPTPRAGLSRCDSKRRGTESNRRMEVLQFSKCLCFELLAFVSRLPCKAQHDRGAPAHCGKLRRFLSKSSQNLPITQKATEPAPVARQRAEQEGISRLGRPTAGEGARRGGDEIVMRGTRAGWADRPLTKRAHGCGPGTLLLGGWGNHACRTASPSHRIW